MIRKTLSTLSAALMTLAVMTGGISVLNAGIGSPAQLAHVA